ncbi:MAG: GNAT family N-acetyltransferase [Kouleothrix sp.]|jgi:ribosomal protein S18 acetylase RimI-like enzyme|nr:GNAT family N-acetyltransferase [Kouleothrix sp.]
MSEFPIRALSEADRAWVRRFIAEHWGDEVLIAHGQAFRPHEHAGFAAFDGESCVGLLTYRLERGECEVLSIDSLREGAGVGSALLAAAVAAARAAGCARAYLITTNDNMRALRFYQRRGFALVALRPRAIERARALKPSIPLVGFGGIPLRDELELELWL